MPANRFVQTSGLLFSTMLWGLLSALPAAASERSVQAELFDRPAVLEPSVAFWRKVFGEVSRHQVLIHSIDYPNKVFTVLDYRADVARGVDGNRLATQRREDIRRTIARIDHLLGQIADAGGSAAGLGDEARAIHALFADLNDPGVYARVKGRVRAQPGVAERTAEGLERAGRYLPYIEEAFIEAGLPLALTRLPMVESSFDSSAYSKVSAAGMWQFMPATARTYMRLDHVTDDRRDPWLSTHAAARHLADDYAMLQDWPLAVTAYNYGRFGVRRALQSVDGKSLADLLERFESRRFGFASRNFYASFLAALDVEQQRDQWFGPLSLSPPAQFDSVETSHFVAWSTLQRLSGWSAQEFARHNPSYESLVRDDRLLVPPNRTIRIAPGQRAAFQREYGNLGSAYLLQRQRDVFLTHRVARGETLSHIARRYNTSASHLQQLNSIRTPTALRAGQNIRVPAPDMPATATATARTTTASATTARGAASGAAAHVVASGDTLSAIAQQYGTSVAQLAAANNLGNVHNLRAGQRLRLPAGGTAAAQREHVVQRGETLSGIARQHGTSVAHLQALNRLGNADRLMPGMKLQLPAAARGRVAQEHQVLRGETLSQIASQYGVALASLAQVNGLDDRHSIRAGQTLRIP